MTAHIKLKAGFQDGDKGELLNRIKQIVNKRFDIEHTTIEFER
jgi:Co/Zn/Cd efflux system component